MSNSNNNWCPEVYRSVYVDRHNDTHVRVAPCCQATTQIESVSSFDFETSPYLNQLRAQFDRGEQPKACDSCWSVEKHGHKSRRQSAIEFFQEQGTAPDCVVQLNSIDYTVNWSCNLACIMCGPYFSSLWAKQENLTRVQLAELGRQFQRNNTVLDQLNLQHVKKLHFNGGEPLLNNDQQDLLIRLKEQALLDKVFVSYNTNGTVMPSAAVCDLWAQTRLVKLFFSIDATGAAFEYVRWPAVWNQVADNILTMKQQLPDNVMFGFNVTVGNYNVLEIAKVYQWFCDNLGQNRSGDVSDFCWQLANNYSLADLPLAAKSQAIEQLDSVTALQGIASYLKSRLNYNEDSGWTQHLDQLDAKRNTNWRQALSIGQYYQ